MENQKQNGSDEIDLGLLFAKIANGISNFGRSVLKLLAIIKNVPLQNKAIFSSLMAISLVTISVYNFSSKKYYVQKVVVSNSSYTTKVLQEIFMNVNDLAKQEDTVGISQLLTIPVSVAKSLKKIEANPFVTETDLIEQERLKDQLKTLGAKGEQKELVTAITERLKLESGALVEIVIHSYDPTVLKVLEKALLDFFLNSEYVKKRYDIARQNLVSKKERLFQESLKLDSLKKAVFENYSAMAKERKLGSNNVILADKSISYPLDLYNQDLAFYDEILKINSQLALRTDFEVVSSFTPSNKPANKSLTRFIKLILIGLSVSISIGYLLVGLKSFNNYLNKFE